MLIVQFVMSMQSGSYGPMIELGTRMGSGHLQLMHAAFHDEPRIEYSLGDVSERLERLDESSQFNHVSLRANAFALVAHDPHSAAALVSGVIPDRERVMSDVPSKVVAGAYLTGDDQAFIGAALARTLHVGVGDEMVLIGTNSDGGIAAAVLTVSGIFEATIELERVMVQVSLRTFQNAFDMPDQAHRIVALVDDPMNLTEALTAFEAVRQPSEVIKDWQELMPEISQAIQIDIVSNGILQFVLILVVVLSIMNTFVMTLFERTREYGMLFAIGMKRGAVYQMTLVEAVLLWIVGMVCGGVLTCLVVVPLMYTGIPVPASEDAMQAQFAFIPPSIYPDLSWWAILTAPLVIGLGAVISVSLAFIRLARLDIVDALRTE